MTNEEIAVKLEAHDHEIGSLKHRMEDAEKATDAVNRLAVTMEGLVTEQKNTSKSVDRLTTKVESIEARPGKHWDSLIEKILLVLAGAFVAWLASGMPGI